MPPHSPSELASHPQSMNVPPACCDCFGLRTAKGLLPESSRPPPGKLNSTAAMFLDRVAELAMGWVKKWVHLWQNFSRALMKATLMSIAKGACRLAAAIPLEEEECPRGEKELRGGKRKMGEGGALNCKVNRQGYLLLNNLEGWPREDVENVFEDGHFGERPEWLFSGAKMGSMALEDNTVLRLMRHSFSIDFESDSESSSNDVEPEGAERPGSFPQKTLEGLDIRGYFEASCSPREEFGDFDMDLEGDSRECAESPFVSQEGKDSVERREDLVMFEEESMESTSDSSEDWEHLSRCEKAKENLGTSTVSCGFKSPLVLSLFYCPSEEDDDDDSEDWSSGDEMEETGQAYLDGAVWENGASSSATEKHQNFPENICGSTQPAAFTPLEPKEITVSFHLRKPDSQPKEFWNPLKLSSPKDQSPATGHPPRHCCQQETESNHDLVTTETFQKESQLVKKVRFSPEVTVHTLVVWDYASRAARRGPWEEMARDRCRFQRRIAEVGAILAPCLEAEHRAKAWRKIHGALVPVQLENTEDTLHSSAEREEMSVSKKL